MVISTPVRDVPYNKPGMAGFSLQDFMDGGESLPDIYTIKTDSMGTLEWQELFDTDAAEDVGYCGIQAVDGTHVVTGYTGNYIEETLDAWVIKFTADSGTTFDISISGGLGVSATITNTGSIDAVDVPWEIHITGGILGKIDKTMGCTLDIPSGQSKTVSTGMFLGLGPISISVSVADTTETVEGTQLVIFSLL
ncbi:MAG: hypothetical protein KKC68_02525 [Candidatus Thermoplasmatota archaeon]|nr:hypothetical protein [Candidatus Thermoplasmatota archaeon]